MSHGPRGRGLPGQSQLPSFGIIEINIDPEGMRAVTVSSRFAIILRKAASTGASRPVRLALRASGVPRWCPRGANGQRVRRALGTGGGMTTLAASSRGQSKSLVLTAMIFAVAMTFIDQTIVSIAATTVSTDFGLSSSGIQWGINAYLLSLAALFAFGGRASMIGSCRWWLWRDHFRGGVGAVRADAERRGGGGVAGDVPRGAGRRRGDHVPGRACHRGGHVRPGLARPRARAVLRHRRRAHGHRPDRRRLPDRVDLAVDLLDQRARRDHRAGAHRHCPSR